jgi:hypothetical protein
MKDETTARCRRFVLIARQEGRVLLMYLKSCSPLVNRRMCNIVVEQEARRVWVDVPALFHHSQIIESCA